MGPRRHSNPVWTSTSPSAGRRRSAPASPPRRRLRGPRFRELGRDTYVAADVPVDDRMRVRAAALEVPDAVVGGWTAVLVHGVDAAPEGARPIELVVGPRHVRRARPGLALRQDVLGEHEVGFVDGVAVTSPIRTAVDSRVPCRPRRGGDRRRRAGARVRVPPRGAARPPGPARQPARAASAGGRGGGRRRAGGVAPGDPDASDPARRAHPTAGPAARRPRRRRVVRRARRLRVAGAADGPRVPGGPPPHREEAVAAGRRADHRARRMRMARAPR